MRKLHRCLSVLAGLASITASADPCNRVLHPFTPDELATGKLFSKQFPDLHRSSSVEAKTQMKDRSGLPSEKIARWFRSIEQVIKRTSMDPEVLARVKRYYLQQNVIRPSEVPQGFYDLQVRLAREEGRGSSVLTPEMKESLARVIVSDQKKSLEIWIDYFLSPESSFIPTWAKVWSFNGLLKLAQFDPETGLFRKRSAGQVAPFPELNREALMLTIDSVIRQKSAVETFNFAKLYGRELKRLKDIQFDLSITDGKWVKYAKGSDPLPLVRSLQGMNTGWCTASETTAAEQLSKGDFYVFYSNDEKGVASIPRIAIRMDGQSIAQIRGVAKEQNLDLQIFQSSVLREKLREFGTEADAYSRKSRHMKRLTEIEDKQRNHLELDQSELRFLYELDELIVGFGMGRDPRIAEIIQQRDIRTDLAIATGYSRHEISLTVEEVSKGGIRFHYGDLNLSHLKSARGWVIPEGVRVLNLNSLLSAEGLTISQGVRILNLNALQTTKGLMIPSGVESLNLSALLSVEGLVIPQGVKYLNLFSLRSVQGFVIPSGLKRLYLDSLASAKGLILPEGVESISLNSLSSTQDLVLPRSVTQVWIGGRSLSADEITALKAR